MSVVQSKLRRVKCSLSFTLRGARYHEQTSTNNDKFPAIMSIECIKKLDAKRLYTSLVENENVKCNVCVMSLNDCSTNCIKIQYDHPLAKRIVDTIS